MEDESVMILLCCLETQAILFFSIPVAGECWVWDIPHVSDISISQNLYLDIIDKSLTARG
jgi:hypothetical protein